LALAIKTGNCEQRNGGHCGNVRRRNPERLMSAEGSTAALLARSR
jgi:hypothetical protein